MAPAMRLYLMRHGPAEDHAASGRDADRALSVAGRGVVEVAAQRLRTGMGEGLSRIVTSPLLRARQTADIVRSLIAPAGLEIEVRDELATDEPAVPLALEVAAAGGEALLVGHQPTIEALARTLCDAASGGVVPAGFRTGMVVGLAPFDASSTSRTKPSRWKVHLVVDPHA